MSCTEQDARLMHQDFEHCEAFEMYTAYIENRVPTLDQISSRLAEVVGKMPENLLRDPEGDRIKRHVQGRSAMVRGNTHWYAASVIRHVRLRMSHANLRDPEMFVKADHDRRRKHENLLKSLADLLKALETAEDFGLCDRSDYHEWNPGDTDPIPAVKIPVFSMAAIENRNLIRDWALAADFAEQYGKLQEMLSQQKEKGAPSQ